MKYYLACLLCCQMALAAGQDTLTLERAVDLALEHNYGLQIARNQAEVPAILNNRGQAGMLPNVVGTTSYNYSNTGLNQEFANGTVIERTGVSNNNIAAGVALDWTLFDGMRMFAARDRLAELEAIGQLELQNRVQQTLYQVELSWYNLLRLQEQLTVTSAFIELLEERVKIATRAFEIGTSAKTDLLQAEIDLQEQQLILLSQNNEIVQAITQLNQFMGQSPTTTYVVRGEGLAPRELDIEELRASLATNNPLVLAARKELAVAVLTEKEARGAKLPTVNFRAGANLAYSRSTAGFALFNFNYGPFAGLGVSVPIYQGGQLNNQIELANLSIDNARLAEQDLQLQLSTFLEQAWNDYVTARETARRQAAVVNLAQENADIAFALFRQRQISSVDLRTVQLVYVQAQNAEILARFTMKQAELDLLLQAGLIGN